MSASRSFHGKAPQHLPEGWTQTQLAVTGRWSTGGTPRRSNPSFFDGDIPFVKIGDLNDGIVTQTEEAISQAGLDSCSTKLLPPGTLSVGLYGSIGKLGILGMQAATNQACANCQVDECLCDSDYLFHYIRSQRSNLLAVGQGGTQPNISNAIIRNWPIPIPPLAEQKRIVAKVEDLLAHVNTARERLERVPVILKRFRQAVLAAACSGRLTEDWRQGHPDVEKAETSLSRCQPPPRTRRPRRTKGMAEVQRPSTMPCTWTSRRVRELVEKGVVIDFQDGNHGELYPGKEDFGEAGRTFLTAKQVFDGQVLYRDAPRLRNDKAAQLRIGFAEPGDVLLTHNATVGRVAILPKEAGPCILGTSVTYYRVNPNIITATFLMLFMQSAHWQRQLRAVMEQTTRNQVSVRKQAEFWVLLPPLEEQCEIAARAMGLLSLAGSVEQRAREAEGGAAILPESILTRAFRGDLVPTEAELARQEGRDYEPASVILERLAAEREARAAKAPARKRRRRRASE